MRSCLLSSILLFAQLFVFAQKKVLDSKLHHLRKGPVREWSEFPVRAKDSVLKVNFALTAVPKEACISLRQYDVNQTWILTLNGIKLGELVIDEKDMISYYSLPSGSLKKGNNNLRIFSSVTGINSDDIKVGQIDLYSIPGKQLFAETNIDVEIRDKKTKELIPSRITIVDQNGALRPVAIESTNDIAVRTGVIYTSKGKVSFGLPVGNYIIYANRGFEYSVDSFRVILKQGTKLNRTFYIDREVNTVGWISCDPHIHTLTHSRHGDATFYERLITIAGEGLEFPVFTEHNLPVEVVPRVKELKLQSYFSSVIGNEITTKVGHFNVFPAQVGIITSYNGDNWSLIGDEIRKTAGVKAIILNHARDIHQGFRPFDPKFHIASAGMNLRKWDYPMNSMEVLNSGSQQTDQFELHRDWFGMMNRGFRLTAVGSSDSHDVNRFIVGQARTYIKSKSDSPLEVDEGELVNNFVEGRTLMSFGLLVEIEVNNKYGPGDLVPKSDKLVVKIRVQGPSWLNADKIRLYANGIKIKEATIAKSKKPLKWSGIWEVPKPNHDVYLVAVAEGPASTFAFWQIAKPFQHSSPDWDPRILGSTGAIRIDADGDGKFTAAYEYAKQLWESSNGNFGVLFKSLSKYDEAVAIQAAAVVTEAGFDLTNREIKMALGNAIPKVKKGFETFIRELKASGIY